MQTEELLEKLFNKGYEVKLFRNALGTITAIAEKENNLIFNEKDVQKIGEQIIVDEETIEKTLILLCQKAKY